MANIPFQTAFGKHRVVNLDTGDESEVQQHCRDECDINFIMARYEKIGIVEHLNERDAQYGDFLSATDYQTAMNAVFEARDAFMSLSSSLRTRFDNDPAKFLEFVHDPNNRDEMIELGMIDVPVENVNNVPSDPVSEA